MFNTLRCAAKRCVKRRASQEGGTSGQRQGQGRKEHSAALAAVLTTVRQPTSRREGLLRVMTSPHTVPPLSTPVRRSVRHSPRRRGAVAARHRGKSCFARAAAIGGRVTGLRIGTRRPTIGVARPLARHPHPAAAIRDEGSLQRRLLTSEHRRRAGRACGTWSARRGRCDRLPDCRVQSPARPPPRRRRRHLP